MDVKYALVDYDVHDNPSLYPVIYAHLGKVAIRFTESVYLVNLAQANAVYGAFGTINTVLGTTGKTEVTFNVTEISETAEEVVRGRSIKALTNQVLEIGNRLLESIERMEQKFDVLTDDVEVFSTKRRNRITRAGRELKLARGLALLFLVEKDVEAAVEATQLVVNTRRAEHVILNDQAELESSIN